MILTNMRNKVLRLIFTYTIIMLSTSTMFGGIVDNKGTYAWVDDLRYIIKDNTYSSPTGCPSEYFDSFDYKDYEGGATLVGYRNMDDIVVPSSISVDGKEYLVECVMNAFYNSKSLKSVAIPSSVNDVSASFSGCKNLERVELSPFIPLLASEFLDCSSLKYIVLPQYLQTIQGSHGCFEGCNALETIILPAVTPPTCRDYDFTKTCYANAILYVPREAIEQYKIADGWKNFYNIKSIDEYEEGENNTDSVCLLPIDDSSYCVYDIMGRLRLAKTNNDGLNMLEKGIYIVNGKKYVIR